MNSPVYAYQRRPSLVDFEGHIAAVFFTTGCNFRCSFCHNADLLAVAKDGLSWDELRGVCRAFRAQWVSGAVISGGEPTLSPDLPDLIRFLKNDCGWAVKLDTNGSRPDVLAECLPMLDYVAVDVKAGLPSYPRLTGFRSTDSVARSVRLVIRGSCPYEFRTTVVGSFHNEEEMRAIGELVSGATRHVLQPFVPRDGLPDATLSFETRTAPDHLTAMREVMESYVDTVSIRGEQPQAES